MLTSGIIIILISIMYIILIFAFIKGWNRLLEFKSSCTDHSFPVAVVIPFRNEAKNLPALCKSLANQDYQNFKIIFVDDHSTDSSVFMINKCCTEKLNFEILNLRKSGVYGKKQAVRKGVQLSGASLIITTDADCIHHKQWISTIVNFYRQYHPKLIIGPVSYYNEQNYFEKMQSLEFMSLAGSTGGAAGLNRPVMCNAANLAFEKQVFDDCFRKMKTQIASGDDIFLLHALKRNKNSSFQYLKSAEAMVLTRPQKSIKSFINQRKRWASKSKAYRDKDTIAVSLIVFLINFSQLAFLIMAFFNLKFLYVFAFLFISKSIPDFLFLNRITGFFQKKHLLSYFFPVTLLYPIYVTITGLLSFFTKPGWKGRKN